MTAVAGVRFSYLPLLVSSFAMLVGVAGANEKPTPIAPETARDHEGELVVVEFEVKAAKNAKRDGKPHAFFDSEYDFHDEKNLGVAVHDSALAEFKKQEIEFATTHFMKKRIRVTGKVAIRDDRPYIDVREASQIQLVATADPKKAPATPPAAPAK